MRYDVLVVYKNRIFNDVQNVCGKRWVSKVSFLQTLSTADITQQRSEHHNERLHKLTDYRKTTRDDDDDCLYDSGVHSSKRYDAVSVHMCYRTDSDATCMSVGSFYARNNLAEKLLPGNRRQDNIGQ